MEKDDYIKKLEYLIVQARREEKAIESRIATLQEVLNEYETMMHLKEQET